MRMIRDNSAMYARAYLAVMLCTFFATLFEGKHPTAGRMSVWYATAWTITTDGQGGWHRDTHWDVLSQVKS